MTEEIRKQIEDAAAKLYPHSIYPTTNLENESKRFAFQRGAEFLHNIMQLNQILNDGEEMFSRIKKSGKD